MKAELDTSYAALQVPVWEVGLSIHGFKVLLIQYLVKSKAVDIYLFGAGLRLSWGKAE